MVGLAMTEVSKLHFTDNMIVKMKNLLFNILSKVGLKVFRN